MSGTPAATVIVPVRNGEEFLPTLLDALAGQDLTEPWEALIVDNGSTDRTASVAAAHPLGPRVVTEARPGSYVARNAGIAASSADVLVFTDVDCTPDRAWLSTGLAAIRAGADLVGGGIRQRLPERPNMWERYDARRHLDQRRYVERMHFAATANLFVTRAVIDVIGGFDPDLRSSGDIELCYRARQAGFDLRYAPDAWVDHVPRRSLRETWEVHYRVASGHTVLRQRHPDVAAAFDAAVAAPDTPESRPAGLELLRRRARSLVPYVVHHLARRQGSRRGRHDPPSR